MPELPEVENLVRGLRKRFLQKTFAGAEVYRDSILQTPREWFQNQIPGKRILDVTRCGKFIQLRLSQGLALWFHLGMTGQLLLESPFSSFPPHTHLAFSFLEGPDRLIYRDIRRFGRIALTPAQTSSLPEGVKRLGPEPLECPPDSFAARFKNRRARIKSLLLNQKVLAGLGNIYADESLHRAGIHPLRRAGRISRARLFKLHEAIGEVLKEATRWGGSSIDDFLHLDGSRGRFQKFHQVYGRGGEKCFQCGTRIRRVRLSGRSSFFCPRCQR